MNLSPSRILCISPHTDDAEVSSGGTISRFLREGSEVHVIVLSRAYAEDSSRPLAECFEAMKVLGVPPENMTILDFPVRRLGDSRQEILDIFVKAKQQIAPDLVIIPSLNDVHQDHAIAAREGLRAFKNHASILCFSYPWNLISFNTTCFIKLTEEDVEMKVRAIAVYKSQTKDYMQPEVIRAWALTNGVAAQTRYAESFEVARLIA